MDNGVVCYNCSHIGYRLANYQGNIVCSVSDQDGTWPNPDDGLSWRHDPVNGNNTSTKFEGFSGGWVSVRCDGSNGSSSNVRNPWG